MQAAPQATSETVTFSTGALWAGRTLSTLPALFLLFDSAGKLVKAALVIEGTIQLGYPETVIVPLGSVLLASPVPDLRGALRLGRALLARRETARIGSAATPVTTAADGLPQHSGVLGRQAQDRWRSARLISPGRISPVSIKYGITIDATDVKVRGNQVIGYDAPASYGIFAVPATEAVTIEGNQVVQWSVGITAQGSSKHPPRARLAASWRRSTERSRRDSKRPIWWRLANCSPSSARDDWPHARPAPHRLEPLERGRFACPSRRGEPQRVGGQVS
jgi:hypothetical protein